MIKPKPEKRTFKPTYEYRKITDYIEAKYNCDTNNFKGMKFTGKPDDPEYCDFWHWLIDGRSISNGCFTYIPRSEEGYPEWVNQILDMYWTEFGDVDDDPDSIKVWVSW